MTSPPAPDPLEPLREPLQQLLATCPEYLPEFEATRKVLYAGQLPEALDPYFDLGVFTDHLIDLAQHKDTKRFPAVFALIEQLLVEGSSDVRNWVGVGVLEGMQNHLANAGIGYALMEPWLGPKTRKAWDALIEGWGG